MPQADTGSKVQALSRLLPGWVPSHDGTTLTGEGEIEVRESEDGVALVWTHGKTRFVLPVDPEQPSAFVLDRLAPLRGMAVAEGKGRLAKCFDPKAVATAFFDDYRALFEKHVGAVKGKRLGDQDARAVLNRFLLRVLLVAFLQSKGWMKFGGRRDYLQSLYRSWKKDPGGYLFHQRLALVFFNALDEPRGTARALLEPQIGEVPYIGGGLFAPELLEKEMGLVVLPEALFEDLFGEGGLISRYDFFARESRPGERTVAVTPEAMGAVLGAFVKEGATPVFEDTAAHRVECKRVIAAQLGVDEGLKKPKDAKAVEDIAESLRGLHVFDGQCRTGTYLVAALEEMTDFACRIEGATDRGAIKRRVAAENLRGLETDETAVQVARFRLALAMISGDREPRPLPDLRAIVKKGGTLSREAVRSFPAESATVEHKASFEWDVLRGARSPEMRLGSLRTVAAFLNSAGGSLYLGVDDAGRAVGMAQDFALIDDDAKEDAFEGRFREFMKNALDPLPLNNVTLKFESVDGATVCAVEVRPSPGVTYLKHRDKSGQEVESVFVRDGNRTIELRGRARDEFVVSRR